MSPVTEDRQKVLDLLRKSDVPLTPQQVAGRVFGRTSDKRIREITGILNELKTCSHAFEFPPERRGRRVRFGHVPPADWLGARIMGMLREAGGRLTLGQVRKNLRKWENGYFDEAIGKLVKEERLFSLTLKCKYFLSSRPSPFDHLLQRQVSALREILERINRHRSGKLSLEGLKAFLNGAAVTGVPPPVQDSGQPSEALLGEWYRKDLPKRGGLSSIPVSWTWAHYESWCLSVNARPDLGRFQDFMRDLHRAGKIEFIPHSMTQELPAREAELSLRGQHGEVLYYWKWR